MDALIRKVEREVKKGKTKKAEKDLKKLEKADKRRDPACDYGMKHMPKKKK